MVGDRELVRQCKEGDLASQELLYKRYAPQLMGVCLRYARNLEDAEDILQDAFVKILLHIHKYDDNYPLVNWLYRITINTAINAYHDKKKWLQSVEVSEVENQLDDVRIVDADFLTEKLLLQLIQELPDGYRTIFNLYEIDGYPQREIAEMLGVSHSTIRTQLFKAKKVLKRRIEALRDESILVYKTNV